MWDGSKFTSFVVSWAFMRDGSEVSVNRRGMRGREPQETRIYYKYTAAGCSDQGLLSQRTIVMLEPWMVSDDCERQVQVAATW